MSWLVENVTSLTALEGGYSEKCEKLEKCEK